LKANPSLNAQEPEREHWVDEQAALFRHALANGSRSTMLVRLFDYMLERSRDERSPKEIEIAMAVFGKNAEFDTSQDSTVRVHVHRLRQRIDSFSAGKSGMRLQIPKGEYRLLLVNASEGAEDAGALSNTPKRPTAQKIMSIVFICCLALCTMLWVEAFRTQSAAHGKTLTIGGEVAIDKRPPLIAVGDFYMVVESGPDGKIQRLSMRPAIRSGRELDDYVKMHPDQYGSLHDRDIHRVPANIAKSAAALLPLLASMRQDGHPPEIIPASQISQEMIDADNIVYIEYFPELASLRLPLLGRSRIVSGPNANELTDISSHRTFKAGPLASDARDTGIPIKDLSGYDYGYIAAYTGPSGHRIIVISAMGNSALSQMIRLASDSRQLDLLSRETRGANSFEALYQVRTARGLVFDTNLVIARALTAAGRAPDAP